MDYLAELEKELMDEARQEFNSNRDYYRSELPNESDEDTIKAIRLFSSGFTGAGRAISDYLKHNHRETLLEAVRNNAKPFKYKAFREFVADVLEGKDVRGKEPYKRIETVKREEKILKQIRTYRKLGYPLKSDKTEMSCLKLTARKLDMKYSYVADIYKKRDRENSLIDGESKMPEQYKRYFDSFWHNVLKLNGGKRPDNWDSLEALLEEMEIRSFGDVMRL
jgi:hypothetical protein